MNDHIIAHLTWDDLCPLSGFDEHKTFEFLCGDFMKLKFNLPYAPAPGGNTYPGTEGPPVTGDDGYKYGFQAKFSDQAYCKAIIESCEKISDGTEILYIFTKGDVPSPTKKDTPPFDLNHPKKTKQWLDGYACHLRSTKGIKNTFYFGGQDLINQIKGFSSLCVKYFRTEALEKELFRSFENKPGVDTRIVEENTNGIVNGFQGNPSLFQDDLAIAKDLGKKYFYHKFCYADTDFMLEKFDEFEQKVADSTFTQLALCVNHKDVTGYMTNGVRGIEDDRALSKRYETLIDTLSSRKGIFASFLGQDQAYLNYQDNVVRFIPKNSD